MRDTRPEYPPEFDEWDGSELMAQVAAYWGLPPTATEADIAKSCYKNTECGAWIRITATGLVVGSIVEGSDQDCRTHKLQWEGEDIEEWLDTALAEIQKEAEQLWQQANEED